MTEPKNISEIKALRKFAELLRADRPEAELHDIVFNLACYCLEQKFGNEWVDRHILASDNQSPFFSGLDEPTGDRRFYIARVIDLAEMIFNLRTVPEVEGVLEELLRHNIEDRFAELEVGKMLKLAGVDFKYVAPGGPRGTSYDLLISTHAGEVCAEVKCKIESNTKLSDTAILNTLKGARSQLPEDQMGAVFLKCPQTWAPDGNIESVVPALEHAAQRFMRGTSRVVSVVMYFNIVSFDDNLSIGFRKKEILNPASKFGECETLIFPTDYLPFIAPRPDWVSFVEVCSQ
jgi:hypothetical protein